MLAGAGDQGRLVKCLPRRDVRGVAANLEEDNEVAIDALRCRCGDNERRRVVSAGDRPERDKREGR